MRSINLLRGTLCSIFFLCLFSFANAQNVGINDDGSLPDNSAVLDIKSLSKGLLIPRMTELQRNAIATPATGLMVFQTDAFSGFYYYDGAIWKIIGTEGGYWNAAADGIYNTNIGKVAIGTDTARAKLHVVNADPGAELMLDGSTSGSTDINIRTNTTADNVYRQFVVSGTESGSKPRLNFGFNDFNIDISAFNPLMQLHAFSDTAMTVYGDVRLPYGKYHGRGMRIFDNDDLYEDAVSIVSSSSGYGLHVDLNAAYGSAAIAAHATEGANGIEAYSDGGIAGYFYAYSGGKALVTGSGNVGIGQYNPTSKLDVAGNINTTGEVNRKNKTGNANLLPIAYGTIHSSGSIHASTGNFSCTWNSTYKRYEIDITGENYYYLNFMTNVTAMGTRLSVKTSSVGGKLLVYLYNSSGNLTQSSFQFVTYKP